MLWSESDVVQNIMDIRKPSRNLGKKLSSIFTLLPEEECGYQGCMD